MLATQSPHLYIGPSDIEGRGVFSAENLAKGSTIEICPVLLLSHADTKLIHRTILHNYYFAWDIDRGTSAIALGFGSIYNHSPHPNAEFVLRKDKTDILFRTLTDIPGGVEITVDYQGPAALKNELWFADRS